MPQENSETGAKKKRAKKKTAAKRPASKKRAARKRPATAEAAPASQTAGSRDKLTEVARSIGSTMGDIVKKTKGVLRRGTKD